eukprot:3343146-Pyramimonas_sp.AAC.1
MMTAMQSSRDGIERLRDDKAISNMMVTDGDHGHLRTMSMSGPVSTTSSPTSVPNSTSNGTSGTITETICS